jgi:hypothetical protein
MFFLVIIILFIVSDFSFSYCDAAINWQLGIQEPSTPSAEGIIFFNNYLCFFFIGYLHFSILVFKNNYCFVC